MLMIIGLILIALGGLSFIGIGIYVLFKIHIVLAIGIISFIAILVGMLLGTIKVEISKEDKRRENKK